jgi:WD40 repeat protein/S1-C subfamily serine protease
MRRLCIAHLLLLIGIVLCDQAGAQSGPNIDVVAIGKRATALVEVTAPKAEEGGSGTAFCIDKSGLFITNAHVIDEAEGGKADIRIVLEPGLNQKRQSLRAKILRSDDRLDLALLKIEPIPGLAVLELGSDDRLSETMPVTTFGYPFGRALTFRRNGYPDITVLESKITSLKRDEGQLKKIQFDNQLNPGNSGGPVLGPDGKLVGVAQMTVKGADINFAIPVGLVQHFLKAPVIVFTPPALAYKDRAKPVTWTIKVQPSTPSASLPDGLSLFVKIATDVTPPRTFDTRPMGNGVYRVTLTPVPPESQTPVELRVLINGAWIETSVPDHPVRVGKTPLLLSDIQQLMERPPRVITRKGEMVVGEILNLGKAKIPTGRRGKEHTIDLSQASQIQVSPSAAAKPLRAIEAIVELKRGGEVIATKAKRLEFPDAPILLVDRNRGIGMIVHPPTPPVMRSPDPETENVKLVLGGSLHADGVPRGAGLSVKPPDVPMGDALLAREPEALKEVARLRGHTGAVQNVAVSRDNRHILSGSSDRTMILWDRESDRMIRRFVGRGGPLLSVAISPDGRRAVSGGDDRIVRIWDVESGGLIREIQGHAGYIRRVVYSPDGRYVASAGGGRNLFEDGVDQAVHVWDAETGREVSRLEGCPGRVWGLNYTPDGRSLFAAGGTAAILWDVQTGREVRRFLGSTQTIECADVLPDGRRGVSAGYDRAIRLWDLETGQESHRFLGHPREVTWVAASPDGRLLLSSDYNAPELRLWDVESQRQLAQLAWENASPIRGSFTPDGRHAVWGGSDGLVRVYRLPEISKQERELTEPLVRRLDAKLTDLAVGGGGRYLILTLKEARQVAVFDVNAAKIVKQIDVPSDEVLVAAGATKLILLYPKEGLFQRWDLPSLTLELKGEKQPIRGRIHNLAMGCDSDGPMLAFWSVQREGQPGITGPGPARCSFIDPITLKVLKIEPPKQGAPMGGAWTSDGSFRINYQFGSNRIHLRASPGGGLFGSWCVSQSPTGIQTIAIDGRSIRLGYMHEDVGHVVPGPDGKTIFTGWGDRRGPDGTSLETGTRGQRSPEVLIPSADPNYYLGVTGLGPAQSQPSGSVAVRVHEASNGSELVTAHDLNEMVSASANERGDSDAMTIDKRFHFIPAANLLITVPPSNDRLVLRRLSLEQGIARSAKPILVVTSASELSARPGQRLAHQIQVRSSKGGVAYDLTLGPEGLSVSPDGVLKWQVPLTAEKKEYEAVLTVSDNSGKKTFHTIKIKVE